VVNFLKVLMRIINVMAVSLDGMSALYPGESDTERHAYGFGSPVDFDFLVKTIQGADAVVVGKGSVEKNGLIDTKSTGGTNPDWFVFTNSGFPEDHKVIKNEVPVTLVSHKILPVHNYFYGAKKIIFGEKNPVHTLIDELQRNGKKTVLLLGGGTLNQLFYKERRVDELFLTLCPVILAGNNSVDFVKPPLPEPVQLVLKSSKVDGNLVFLKYRVQNQDSI
jgi:riboflavin biosynthesis pyrimidine reductase